MVGTRIRKAARRIGRLGELLIATPKRREFFRWSLPLASALPRSAGARAGQRRLRTRRPPARARVYKYCPFRSSSLAGSQRFRVSDVTTCRLSLKRSRLVGEAHVRRRGFPKDSHQRGEKTQPPTRGRPRVRDRTP